MIDEKYSDMLNMPHHISKKHHQMAIKDRAAQFSPFSALPGYEENIRETARLTDTKIELSTDAQRDLDNKLQILKLNLDKKPVLEIYRFVPDASKKGGSYITSRDSIAKIDDVHSELELSNGDRISISAIYSLDGAIFKTLWQ